MDKIFEEHGFSLNQEAKTRFEIYTDTLLSWNSRINLTTITDREQIYIKHYADSLMAAKYVSFEGKTLVDIGTGPGFPGLALGVYEPLLNVCLMDSRGKKVAFLDELIVKLNLKNVSTLTARAEDVARDNDMRECFDIAASRAVAGLSALCEYALPYVKIGGLFIAYKGADYEEELALAKTAIATLGGEVERVECFNLGRDDELSRSLIFIRKLSQTPFKYPRKSNTIIKRPII